MDIDMDIESSNYFGKGIIFIFREENFLKGFGSKYDLFSL